MKCFLYVISPALVLVSLVFARVLLLPCHFQHSCIFLSISFSSPRFSRFPCYPLFLIVFILANLYSRPFLLSLSQFFFFLSASRLLSLSLSNPAHHPCVFCFSVRILALCFIFSWDLPFFLLSFPLSFFPPALRHVRARSLTLSLSFLLRCLSFAPFRLFFLPLFYAVFVPCLSCFAHRVYLEMCHSPMQFSTSPGRRAYLGSLLYRSPGDLTFWCCGKRFNSCEIWCVKNIRMFFLFYSK